MGLTTRPPGTGPGVGPAESSAPVPRELRALAEQIRALASEAASDRPFPPWPELRATPPEAVLARWFRSALESGHLTPAALKELVEAAVARLAASATPAASRPPLDAARDVALRLLAVAGATPPGPGAAAAMTVFIAQVAKAVSEAAGRGASLAPPPVAAEDPSHAAQALVGWLRTAAPRSGASPALLAAAVEAGAARALETLARTSADPEGRAAIETARALIARGLAAGEGPSGPFPLLYRPDMPPRAAVAGTRVRGPGGHERVLPVGEEERAPLRDPRPASAGEESTGAPAEPVADNPIEGPMQCIRRTVDALLAADTRTFTAQWVYPACFWIDGRWLACDDEAALGDLQARILRGRRERGVAGGRILLLRVDPAGDAVALVHVLLSEERQDGGTVREVEALYTTVRTADGWRVAAALAK